mmetsp:Transcript_52947/g.133795  ORF Transcript_52947/g.133795 Transcript_52947/m.133795 type:complete len:217 (-) Transcript_52947:439-1089(-)
MVQQSKEVDLLGDHCDGCAALNDLVLVDGLHHPFITTRPLRYLMNDAKRSSAQLLTNAVELRRCTVASPADDVAAAELGRIQILVLSPQAPSIELDEFLLAQHAVAVLIELLHASTNEPLLVFLITRKLQAQLLMQCRDEPLQLVDGKHAILVHIAFGEEGAGVVLQHIRVVDGKAQLPDVRCPALINLCSANGNWCWQNNSRLQARLRSSNWPEA